MRVLPKTWRRDPDPARPSGPPCHDGSVHALVADMGRLGFPVDEKLERLASRPKPLDQPTRREA